MRKVDIITYNKNERIRFGTLNEFGILTKTMDHHVNIIKKVINEKFKEKCNEIEEEYKQITVNAWKNSACTNYDFILTFCSLFTIQNFETLAYRIYIPSRKKRSSRWGIGKRVYNILRPIVPNLGTKLEKE